MIFEVECDKRNETYGARRQGNISTDKSENVDNTNDVLLVHGEVQQEAGAHCGHATEPGHQDQC